MDTFFVNLSQLLIPNMNETKKSNQNLEESILDESKNATLDNIVDDDVVTMTKVLPGERSPVYIALMKKQPSLRGLFNPVSLTHFQTPRCTFSYIDSLTMT